MTTRASFGERLGIGVAAILWFLLAFLAFVSYPVVTSGPSWFPFLLLGAAVILAFPVAWLWRKLRGSSAGSFPGTVFRAAVALALILVCVVGLPVYYLAYMTVADPYVAPLVTLSDGTKTVVFQGMSHVGSENFYKSVVFDLEKALADGYVLFYEGVQPGDEESQQFFSEMLAGGGDLSDTYRLLSEVCGLRFQLDYFNLLEKDKAEHPERHVAADVTSRQMLDEYNRLHPDHPWRADAATHDKPASDAETAPTSDSMFDMLQWIESGGRRRQQVTGIVCRGYMTWMFNKESTSNELTPIIRDFRNRKLVERIVSSPSDKIYITYGAAHVPGVIRLLEERVPRWKVVDAKWVRTIENEQRPIEKELPTAE